LCFLPEIRFTLYPAALEPGNTSLPRQLQQKRRESRMPTLKETLKREFDIEPSQFSPELRICLERLEKLEQESEELERHVQEQRNER
jgi:hypothetical protein